MEEGGGWEDGWGFWIGHFCGAQEVVFFLVSSPYSGCFVTGDGNEKRRIYPPISWAIVKFLNGPEDSDFFIFSQLHVCVCPKVYRLHIEAVCIGATKVVAVWCLAPNPSNPPAMSFGVARLMPAPLHPLRSNPSAVQ